MFSIGGRFIAGIRNTWAMENKSVFEANYCVLFLGYLFKPSVTGYTAKHIKCGTLKFIKSSGVSGKIDLSVNFLKKNCLLTLFLRIFCINLIRRRYVCSKGESITSSATANINRNWLFFLSTFKIEQCQSLYLYQWKNASISKLIHFYLIPSIFHQWTT